MAITMANPQSLLHRGTGPVATVYVTVPPDGGRASAVKVYPGTVDRHAAAEVLDEQRTLSGLRSVSAILLFDGMDELPDGRTAIRMELCVQSLAELVETAGPLRVPDAVTLGETLARVLTDAHAVGIVHGGVTPTNVLFRPAGQPVLADFGLTLRQRFPRRPEAAAAYTAPEVLRGAEPTAAADLYGLGAVLHFALTGEAPFPARLGEPAGEVLLRVLSAPPPTISGPDLPAALPSLVTALLAKDPAHRPGGAEVLEALRALGGDTPAPDPGDEGPDFDDFRDELPARRTSSASAWVGPTGVDPPDVATGLPSSGPDTVEQLPSEPPPLATPVGPVASTPNGSTGATVADQTSTPPPDAVPPDAVPPDAVPPDAVPPDAVPPGGPAHRPPRERGQPHSALLAGAAVLAVLLVLLGALGRGVGTSEPDAAPPDATTPSTRDTTLAALTPAAPGPAEPGSAESRPGPTAGPSTATTPPPATGGVRLEIRQIEDTGRTITLTWRSSKPLTYAVFVAEQGRPHPSIRYRGAGTSLTIPVEPHLKYCFQVQGTDGTATYESAPRSIRGATCLS
jgi:serine/threonine protein kinase